MTQKKPLTLVLHADDLNRPLTNLVNEASVEITLKPSDDFVELMTKHNFTQRGKFAWALSTRENERTIMRFIKEYSEDFTPQTLISGMEDYASNTIKSFSKDAALSAWSIERYQEELNKAGLREALNALPGFSFPRIKKSDEYEADFNTYRGNNYYNRNRNREVFKELQQKYATLGGVILEIKNDLLWVRLFPVLALAEEYEKVNLPKLKNVRYSRTTFHAPRNIIKIVAEYEKEWGDDTFDHESEPVFNLMDEAKQVISVGYLPNQPATVVMTRGELALAPRRSALTRYKLNEENKVSLDTVLDLQAKHPNANFLIHPGLTDVMNMTQSEPYQEDDRLFEYQKQAVGLHLSTEIGYLQSCAPGMGKTVMQLAAMRARAKNIPAYRGLIVCEANVRQQWQEEAAVWFPEATTTIITNNDDLDDFVDALSETGPAIIILSYTGTLTGLAEQEKRAEQQMKLAAMNYTQRLKAIQEAAIPPLTMGSLLLDSTWHDICADEAMVIRNGSSKQSNFMWTLRKNSHIATALTATPINKGADDLGRLIAWVRNDKNMFTGASLEKLYDTTDAKEATKLFKSFGPLIFRRDTSELKNEAKKNKDPKKAMPDMKQDVLMLTPSAAEKALATAAAKELKRCYLELVAALDEAEKAADGNVDAAQLAEVKENLKAARGAWLGGTNLARMATSDPAALQNSESVGAALLAGQGLIEAAMRKEPTKRTKFIEQAQKRIAKGQQILVFTAFSSVAELLVESLQENGINAKAYTGKNGRMRDRARKEFQEGTLDVLVCTKAAERGLTLHKAAAIYHYDLPWTLEAIIQRTGRSIRIGSENPVVDIVFMVMEGTIEQEIAERLLRLGITSSLILDNSRGKDLKETETMGAMSGLVSTLSKKSEDKNIVAFGELLFGKPQKTKKKAKKEEELVAA